MFDRFFAKPIVPERSCQSRNGHARLYLASLAAATSAIRGKRKTDRLGAAFLPRRPCFKLGDPTRQYLLLFTSLGRHCLDRLELFATDEVDPGEDSLELIADSRL